MSLATRITELRKAKGMGIDELALLSGVPKSTLSKISAGITTAPTLSTVQAIASALGCRLDDLDDEDKVNADTPTQPAMRVAHAYDKATPPVKKTVEVALEPFMEASSELAPEIETVELREYDEPAAAGYGNYLTHDGYRIRTFVKNEVPSGTDFCVRLDGDSMEPKYPDGSTVYVKAAHAIDAGQIGIFMTDADGKAYCKKLIVDHRNRQTRLVSLNQAYEDIVITPDDELRTVGRVLGVAGE